MLDSVQQTAGGSKPQCGPIQTGGNEYISGLNGTVHCGRFKGRDVGVSGGCGVGTGGKELFAEGRPVPATGKVEGSIQFSAGANQQVDDLRRGRPNLRLCGPLQ